MPQWKCTSLSHKWLEASLCWLLFATPTESQYSPTEVEALAVAWSLGNARMFVCGCKDLTLATDDKPLLGILNNCNISNIPNPRICSLKEKTLQYAFKTIYCPGKWQRDADAVSLNPTFFSLDLTLPICQDLSDEDIAYAESINDSLSKQIISNLLNLINERPDIHHQCIISKLTWPSTTLNKYALQILHTNF